MAEISQNFGVGGANLTPGGSAGQPALADVLRDIADDLAGTESAWQAGVVVAAHTVTLPNPGMVVAVEATTATSAGPKALRYSATPAAGEVRVQYSASGVPTLTFNATDAVTACAVAQIGGANVLTTKG